LNQASGILFPDGRALCRERLRKGSKCGVFRKDLAFFPVVQMLICLAGKNSRPVKARSQLRASDSTLHTRGICHVVIEQCSNALESIKASA
jgi:hypothetical protein